MKLLSKNIGKVNTGYAVADSIYNEPEKWRADRYYFAHRETGYSIWIANGFSFFRPTRGSFAFFEKLAVRKAYKWWMKSAPMECR